MACERNIDGVYDLSKQSSPSVKLTPKITQLGFKSYYTRKYQPIVQAEDIVESSNVCSEAHGKERQAKANERDDEYGKA